MERIEQAQGVPPAADVLPVADRLRGFGLGMMGVLASAPAIDFYSVVAGELRRHRDLAQTSARRPTRTSPNDGGGTHSGVAPTGGRLKPGLDIPRLIVGALTGRRGAVCQGGNVRLERVRGRSE